MMSFMTSTGMVAMTQLSRVMVPVRWSSPAKGALKPKKSIGFMIRMICRLPRGPSLNTFILPLIRHITLVGVSVSSKITCLSLRRINSICWRSSVMSSWPMGSHS